MKRHNREYSPPAAYLLRLTATGIFSEEVQIFRIMVEIAKHNAIMFNFAKSMTNAFLISFFILTILDIRL